MTLYSVYRTGRLIFTGPYKQAREFLAHRRTQDGGKAAEFTLMPASEGAQRYKHRHKSRSH